ncbi:MAG: thrombospondin type 3 repeat-containing protein [Planctomycetes bacterium]|nr:thrombospondin type 3 repeat-containing protein [Planctomycetota bacterium]
MLSAAIISAVCAASVSLPPSDERPEPGRCGHARAAVLRAQPWAEQAARQRLSNTAGDTDVLHYDLELEVDPGSEWLGGTNVITVRSQRDGLATFQFQLDAVFAITDVTVNGTPAVWNRVDSVTVEVTLDQAYNAGAQFDLAITYNGSPVSRGWGSIEFTEHGNGQPLVATLSQPWWAYTWWPVKDDNTDKATADLAFTVPDNLVVASNGVLVAEEDLGAQKRYRWSTAYQTAPYLFCFGAANYHRYVETYGGTGGTMPVEFYVFPEDDTPSHRNDWLETLTMIDVFGQKYGDYPFIDEKYGMYQFPFGGGMEHQTMTGQYKFWGGWDYITAHELAHQWWGDMITCATWHDIWLNEGFAVYSEAIWYENKPGSSGKPALFKAMSNRRPGRVDDSVYVYDISDAGRVFSYDFTYLKAGWVLHQLRHVMGDAAFFELIEAYRAAFAYGTATTEDFIAVAESVYGGELAWFFDEWVYGVGAPAYKYAWRQTSVDGGSTVELQIEQVQKETYPLYKMPIDIVMTRGGQSVTYVVWNSAQSEQYTIETAGAVDSLAVDPENWILTTAVTRVPFTAGPPRILSVAPVPGSQVSAASGLTVEIVFDKDVVANSAHFSLLGDSSGPLPHEFAYDRNDRTVTLSSSGAVPLDSYTLTISDGIVCRDDGLALDGEIADAADPGSLPSGNGTAGGGAVIRFGVVEAGSSELDSDGDGVPDSQDGCPRDSNKSEPGACGCGVREFDTDGDGIPDCIDIEGQSDRDGDGVPDFYDGCPDDADKVEPGACGCGVADVDSDGDSVPDCIERCPGADDRIDRDGDGTPDCADRCPDDPFKTIPGICGCGVPDVDSDGDGIVDCRDNCPDTPNSDQADTDGDGIGDACQATPGKEEPGGAAEEENLEDETETEEGNLVDNGVGQSGTGTGTCPAAAGTLVSFALVGLRLTRRGHRRRCRD